MVTGGRSRPWRVILRRGEWLVWGALAVWGGIRVAPQVSAWVGIGESSGSAPAIELEAVDGSRIGERDVRGRVIVLTFWASWCLPCRVEMPTLEALRTLVVTPTYNEAENVIPLVTGVLTQDLGLEALVVDDASPDGTGDLVRERMQAEPRLHLLQREGKLGLGTAYLAGFRYAMDNDFDQVVTMDCDFSHDPRYLPDLLAAMEDHDMVIGSRYVPGGGIANWPLHRRLLSSFANLYTRVLLRLPVHDCTSGYRCYRVSTLRAVDPFSVRSSGYSFLEEMVSRVHRGGFSIGESPILFEDRVAGTSKINRSEIWRAAWHVLQTALSPPKLPPRAS